MRSPRSEGRPIDDQTRGDLGFQLGGVERVERADLDPERRPNRPRPRVTLAPAASSQSANWSLIRWRTVAGESGPVAFLSGSNSTLRSHSTRAERSASGRASKMNRSNLTALGASGLTVARRARRS